MAFETSAYLRRATGRAKSDVANKLVGMFLHEVSRRLCGRLELSVSDSRYAGAVQKAFGFVCCYCGRPLESDRASVEHLEGMNRFRAGLHIPGNVIVSCTRCNREKRRDDSNPKLTLAESGWESFLLHNSTNCPDGCASCKYWCEVWPDQQVRITNLKAALKRIRKFRENYSAYLQINARARKVLTAKMDAIYRDCQQFAEMRIRDAVDQVAQEFVEEKSVKIED